MRLSLPTRALIAKEFGFTKVGATHVSDNRIVSDGYNVDDVERQLSTENLQKFTGVEDTDSSVLWDLMVAKVEGRQITPEVTQPVVEVPVETPTVETPAIEPKKRGGRPAGSKNKK